jgi:hypothetical protein
MLSSELYSHGTVSTYINHHQLIHPLPLRGVRGALSGSEDQKRPFHAAVVTPVPTETQTPPRIHRAALGQLIVTVPVEPMNRLAPVENGASNDHAMKCIKNDAMGRIVPYIMENRNVTNHQSAIVLGI